MQRERKIWHSCGIIFGNFVATSIHKILIVSLFVVSHSRSMTFTPRDNSPFSLIIVITEQQLLWWSDLASSVYLWPVCSIAADKIPGYIVFCDCFPRRQNIFLVSESLTLFLLFLLQAMVCETNHIFSNFSSVSGYFPKISFQMLTGWGIFWLVCFSEFQKLAFVSCLASPRAGWRTSNVCKSDRLQTAETEKNSKWHETHRKTKKVRIWWGVKKIGWSFSQKWKLHKIAQK